ncbi:MAG: 4-hydroxy-tetrahydrodipicolinate reductase [Pseudomonadota bacterium]|nr:4-hydroxy-tetrahydrodipicolinate reductase [Pseudomonadota bacterium]
MKLAIAGCTGRMGLALVRCALATEGVRLTCGSERPGFDRKAAEEKLLAGGGASLTLTSNPEELVAKAEAVIDFTTPQATLEMARIIARRGGIHVVGTTGFTDSQQQEIEQLAAHARIVQSGNFSLGVNVLESLVEQAARILDESYDIEVSEMHHKHKKDAPSGTALMLGRAAARGRGVSLEDKKPPAREGMGERQPGEIGFMSARGGDIVGLHSVMLAGPGELIELKHQAFSRDIFAHGAIRAALWARNQPPGIYSMRQVLGL